MPPETIIAIVTAMGGTSVLVGAVLFGSGLAEKRGRRRIYEQHRTVVMLRKELQTAEERLHDTERQLKECDEQSEDLVERVSEPLREEIDSLSTRLAEEQRRVTELTSKLEEQNKRVNDLTEKLEEAESKVQSSKGQEGALAHIEKTLVTAERDRDRAQKELKQLRDEQVPKLEKRIAELESELRKSRQQKPVIDSSSVAKLEKKLRDTERERDELKAKLDKALKRLEVSDRLMEGVRARSNALARDLAAAREELERLRGA